jgi:hypothetical protein
LPYVYHKFGKAKFGLVEKLPEVINVTETNFIKVYTIGSRLARSLLSSSRYYCEESQRANIQEAFNQFHGNAETGGFGIRMISDIDLNLKHGSDFLVILENDQGEDRAQLAFLYDVIDNGQIFERDEDFQGMIVLDKAASDGLIEVFRESLKIITTIRQNWEESWQQETILLGLHRSITESEPQYTNTMVAMGFKPIVDQPRKDLTLFHWQARSIYPKYPLK